MKTAKVGKAKVRWVTITPTMTVYPPPDKSGKKHRNFEKGGIYDGQ